MSQVTPSAKATPQASVAKKRTRLKITVVSICSGGAVYYHTSFKPPCNWRPTVCELANLPKPALPTVRAALVGLDKLKNGVLVRLKDSARNSSRRFSAKRKSL